MNQVVKSKSGEETRSPYCEQI